MTTWWKPITDECQRCHRFRGKRIIVEEGVTKRYCNPCFAEVLRQGRGPWSG